MNVSAALALQLPSTAPASKIGFGAGGMKKEKLNRSVFVNSLEEKSNGVFKDNSEWQIE